MLNGSLNQVTFDSTHFQRVFNNVERPAQTPRGMCFNNDVGRMLKQMLKPFIWALKIHLNFVKDS